MRYQALILLFVILASSYIFRQNSVFSQGGEHINQQQATVVDSLNLGSSATTIEKNESQINSAENSSATEQLSPVTTSAAQVAPPDVQQPQSQTDPSIVEQSIIDDATSSLNELCVPVEAKIFIAQTIDGASVLYEKNSQNRWPIASITKLMTAVVATENLKPADVVTITPAIMDAVAGNNSFNTGDSFTVNDAIKGMLAISSNDLAYALADSMGRTQFVQKMNDTAKEISMSQTDFYEPSGLSYLNQSTAHDIYLLLTYIQKHYPGILNTTWAKTVRIKNLTTKTYKTLTNINEFAGRKDFFGGKTGYIDQSEGNLVSLFNKGGKMVYIGVFGSPDRFGETEKILSCIQ